MESTAEKDRQTTPLRSVPTKNPLSSMGKVIPIVVILVIVLAGTGTGFFLSQKGKTTSTASVASDKGDEVSSQVKESFAQTFKDQAEGTIEKNDKLVKYAQGTHRLVRAGGESQTAYLTSSVLDLDKYVGKKVKVFGETFGSTQVGWLMDVGKVEETK